MTTTQTQENPLQSLLNTAEPNQCKGETSLYMKKYRAEHKERISFLNRRWRAKNGAMVDAERREYRIKHNEEVRAKDRERYAKNRVKLRVQARERRTRNHDRIITRDREYRGRNAEKIKTQDNARYHRNIEESRAAVREYRSNNIERIRELDRERYQRQKAKRLALVKRGYQSLRAHFFQIYGRECVCCHEDDPGFLTVGHINNDGKLDKVACKNSSTSILRMAIKSPDYTKYETQCYNCNFGANVNNGVCPHKMLKES